MISSPKYTAPPGKLPRRLEQTNNSLKQGPNAYSDEFTDRSVGCIEQFEEEHS